MRVGLFGSLLLSRGTGVAVCLALRELLVLGPQP